MNSSNFCESCKSFNTCEKCKSSNCNEEELYSELHEEECSLIESEVKDIEFKPYENDIRVDFVVGKKEIYKLWGQVKDVKGHSVYGALVTLLKPEYIKGKLEYTPILTAHSDCMGFYYFETKKLENNLKYIVTVSK